MATLRLQGGTITLPTGAVGNEQVATGSIDTDKLEQFAGPSTNFDLAKTGTPVAHDAIVWVAPSAGNIRAFHSMLWDTGTTTDIDFDCKKNGTTVLSAVVNHTHGDADKAVKDGTISVTTFAADDVLSIDVAITSSTGAQGPFAWVEVDYTTP